MNERLTDDQLDAEFMRWNLAGNDEAIAFYKLSDPDKVRAAFIDGLNRGVVLARAAVPAVQPQEPVAWIEHHKGGDNLSWEQVNHPYAKATPLYAAPQAEARQEQPKPDSSYSAQPKGEEATERDAARYRSIRAALLSGGPEWNKLAAMLNIAPDTPAGVDDAVDAALSSNPAQGDGGQGCSFCYDGGCADEKGCGETDRATSGVDACRVDQFSSRCCERGTKGCTVAHGVDASCPGQFCDCGKGCLKQAASGVSVVGSQPSSSHTTGKVRGTEGISFDPAQGPEVTER